MGFLKIPKGAISGAQIPRDLVFSWHFHRGIEILKYHENIRSPVISAALMVPSGINKAPEKQTQIFEAEIEVLEYPPPTPSNPVHPHKNHLVFVISHFKEQIVQPYTYKINIIWKLFGHHLCLYGRN